MRTALFALVCFPLTARADPMELRSRAVDPGSIVIDGDPGEWRGVRARRLGDCGEHSGDWDGPDDASARFAIAHDAERLYFSVRVRDDEFRAGRDKITLHLAFPTGRVHAIELTPGDGQRSAAKVELDGRAVRGGEAVEMIRDPGWSAEASLPWDAMPEARRDRSELRAAVVLEDSDSSGSGRISTAQGDPRRADHLGPLWLSDQESTLNTFLAEHDLRGAWPSFEASGNVAGDALRERVLVVDTYLVVFGPGYRGGRGYFFTALPVGAARDVREARLADVTGDGRDDILLRYVEPGGGGVRGVFAVHSFRGEDLVRVFAVETRKEVRGRFVEANVELRGRGADTRIEVRPGRAQGLDARSFREAQAGDMEPILLPWGPIERRVYRFDAGRFVKESEDAREVEAAPEPARTPAGTTEAAPAPVAPSQAEVFTRFLSQSRLEGVRPSFDRRGNVAGDAREERVAIVGKRLVVLGPGFAGGTSFFFMDLPVAETADVLALDLRDGNADGRADAILRIRQRGEGWSREILEVLAFEGEQVRPALLAEVALVQGENRLDTEVRFVREGRGHSVEIRAGRARGFTRENFPTRAAEPRVQAIPTPW